jgi:chaperonin GroEL (HSP60 family)
MVTLYVGGDTLEEKENRQHLFDDAVRGCKSAVRNGVVVGGNTVIPMICHRLLDYPELLNTLIPEITAEINMPFSRHMEYKRNFTKFIKDILHNIEVAYTRAYAIILNNGFNNWNQSYRKAKKCVAECMIYDLVYGKVDHVPVIITEGTILQTPATMIINSSEVDTQILTAATSIIDLIIASNQYLRVPSREEMVKNM